jgi:hypothetical protein
MGMDTRRVTCEGGSPDPHDRTALESGPHIYVEEPEGAQRSRHANINRATIAREFSASLLIHELCGTRSSKFLNNLIKKDCRTRC